MRTSMTREQWLLDAIEILRADMQHVAPVPRDVLILDNWPGDVEFWSKQWCLGTCSEAYGWVGIFVAPRVVDSIQALETLVHELVHASVGNDQGHNKVFTDAAYAMGLEGNPESTAAGAKLTTRLHEISDMLGTYPGETV
jgi:hypothetical protein